MTIYYKVRKDIKVIETMILFFYFYIDPSTTDATTSSEATTTVVSLQMFNGSVL